MRVLYHHRTLGDGAEGIHVSSVVEAMRGLGHEVRVMSVIGTRTNVTNTRTRLLGPLVKALPRFVYELMELAYSLLGYWALTRHVAAWRPDFIYERYALFNLAGVLAARRTGLRLVLEVNAPLALERRLYERLALRRLARRCERYVCSRADVVIAVSTPLKEYLISLGVSPDRIVVEPNGADPDQFQPRPRRGDEIRARYGIPSEAVVVGFTGILRPWHGVDMLIEALAQIPRSNLRLHALIVGDGPSLSELQALVRARGVSELVTFTGRVPHDDIADCVAAFDLGVSPRATFYASPMKIPEYMASGIPVIGPRMPNITDLVTEGVDGACFEPESVDDLSRVLHRLAADGQHRLRLSRSARQSILTGRTWRHIAARLVALGAHETTPRGRTASAATG
jgi:glycosyltransferase involved in cell wall biosynthesis